VLAVASVAGDYQLHTVFVALILAQCATASVFFARCNWLPHIKVLSAALALACLWMLLVGTMETTEQNPVVAGAWAVCLMIEAGCVWLIVTGLEMCVDFRPAVARTRFNLFQLLIGTTLVAGCLGGARVWASKYGFALAEVPEWEFFWHVQLAAGISAVMAVGIVVCYRLLKSWIARATLCIAAIVGGAFVLPLLYLTIFTLNISLDEMRWLFASEGLFLLATLAPMEVLREERDIYISK
jgi:hypothetical protein